MLNQIDFYHLKNDNFVTPAISIAQKVLVNSAKLLILAPENKLSDLSVRLWSDKTDSFLAHGIDNDDVSDFATIWLSSSTKKNPISADHIILTSGLSIDDISSFKRVFNLFDGSSQTATEQARNQWRTWSSNREHLCRYFTQTDSGGWQYTASNAGE